MQIDEDVKTLMQIHILILNFWLQIISVRWLVASTISALSADLALTLK